MTPKPFAISPAIISNASGIAALIGRCPPSFVSPPAIVRAAFRTRSRNASPVQSARYQCANECRPGVTIVVVNFIDGAERFGTDLPIDPGHIDIDDPHRHSGEPFATIRPYLLLQAAFAREHREGGPR